MPGNDAMQFLRGLQRWPARGGYLAGRLASRLGLPSALQDAFNRQIHGRYSGNSGKFDLRPGTIDAWKRKRTVS